MKKISAFILSLLFMVGATGCGKGATAPVYNSDEKFEIGMWVGISDKLVTYDENGNKVSERMLSDDEFLERYQEIADAGFTIALLGYDVMLDGGSYNLKALKAALPIIFLMTIILFTVRGQVLR